MLKFMNDHLSRKGHQVVTAEDGITALDVLKTFTPDIIFVDLIMPNIEGKKLCQVIRANSELKNIQIVIISGIAAEEE
jgi:DNA-binding response OmpR family regulator